jgi:surface protein
MPDWNVALVTNMGGLFSQAFFGTTHNSNFNLDISGWEVSQVTDMYAMFEGSSAFNRDIGAWVTSSVTDMETMFKDASAFNQDISSWDVAAVTRMENMFLDAVDFNQDITGWTTPALTSGVNMFQGATAFLRKFTNCGLYGFLTVCSRVGGYGTSSFAFDGVPSAWQITLPFPNKAALISAITACLDDFDTGLGCCSSIANGGPPDYDNAVTDCGPAGTVEMPYWDVSLVTDMKDLFKGKGNFDQPLGNWEVSQVTTMEAMFHTSGFNQDIDSWDVSAVTSMGEMFTSAMNFNTYIGSWNTGAVTKMNEMFASGFFNQDIGRWNVAAVTDMSAMFASDTSFNQNLGQWNVAAVTTMNDMFNLAVSFDEDITQWTMNAGTVLVTDMFDGATRFLNQYTNTGGGVANDGPPTAWQVNTVTAFADRAALLAAVNSCLGVDSTGATCCSRSTGSANCGAAGTTDMSRWNVALVTDFDELFNGKVDFNQDIGNWDVSAVTSMQLVFFDARSFNKDIGD